ncbi:MAG: methyltransferase domain-containing protein [Candidatus Acidiferrales bacterium]
MGASNRERKRLMRQGTILREPLAAAFRGAGITSRMRVLDIGCGVGDVSILAAESVGPSGSVVGLDHDAASVAWATGRVAEAGFANIQFRTGEFGEFNDSQDFDALVGRLILMYLPDPVATLRYLISPFLLAVSLPVLAPKDAKSGWLKCFGIRVCVSTWDASVPHLSGCGVRRLRDDDLASQRMRRQPSYGGLFRGNNSQFAAEDIAIWNCHT